jgi:hypothetical protein
MKLEYNGVTISGVVDSMKIVPIYENGKYVGNLIIIEIKEKNEKLLDK